MSYRLYAPRSLFERAPAMLHPKESSFTGGGFLVIRLPDSVQQSLKHRHSPALRFSLVFEGQHRRHIATCHLVDDSCVVSVIPEHKSCTESVHLFLYLHEPAGFRLVLRQDFIFTAIDPFDIIAASLLSLAVRWDLDFPLTWKALIGHVDDWCLPRDWSRDRLLAAVDCLCPVSDGRLSSSLRRIESGADRNPVENLKGIVNGNTPSFEGRSTVLHFLATHGLIASTSVIFRLLGKETAVWAVKNQSGDLPADLADRSGFTEFGLLLRCPLSIRKWVRASTEAHLRVTSGESVARISHPSHSSVVMTTNKEKSGFSIEQDVQIHRTIEDSQAEGVANAYRRVALNGGVPDSPTTYSVEQEILDGDSARFMLGADPGESGSDHVGEDESSLPSASLLVHNTDTMDFVPLAAGADHPPGSPFVLRATVSTSGDGEITPTTDGHLGGCTMEELVDDSEPTWSCTLTKETRTRYTRKYIKRQDLIWEMIGTERNYVRMLIAIREVYRDPFLQEFVHRAHTPTPDSIAFTASHADDLFPCVDKLASIHGSFLHRLVQEQSFREDRAIHNLGDMLLSIFQGPQGEEMVCTYGEFYARHMVGKRRVEELKQSPKFAAFLSRCESDVRIKRRTLDDIYLIINQRFSKLESLLVAIIENTINQADEAEKLTQAKNRLKGITYRAEEMLGESQNKEMLDRILENFDKRSTTGAAFHQVFRMEDLSSSKRRILHYGKLRVFRSAIYTGGSQRASHASLCKMTTQEVLCLLFSDMFVLLQETRREDGHEKRYQFLKEDGPAPSVLPFAYLSNCIVRESPQRHNSEFELYVIFNYANASCRYSLYTTRQDERAKWAKALTDAAMNTELKTDDVEESLSDRLNSIDQKFKRGCEYLSEMQNADWEMERLINIKAQLWQLYLENWSMSDLQSPSPELSSEKRDKEAEEEEMPNVGDIEGMMKLFSREATKLHMLIHSCNTNLTRSASSATDQAFTAGGPVAGRGATGFCRRGGGTGGSNLPRRHETFSGYDSSTAGKMTAGMYGKRPSLETATSDESVGTAEKTVTPNSAKSDSTLKVKLPNNSAILRHPEGTSKNKDASRRRSSVNIGNLWSKFTKSSDKSHSETPRTSANPAPTSPTSPAASDGTASSLASPAESGAPNRLSSNWDWSREYIEGSAQSPNRSVVQSLSTLNSETRRLIGTLSRLRTHLASMHNRLRRAEEESRTLQSGNITPGGSELSSSSFHVVRETEKLRNQRAELERERTEFGKQRQRDIAKLETEREEIMAKQEDLKKEKESLAEAKERFAEAQRVLQVQIEQHERRGVPFKFGPEVEELLFPGGRSEEISPRPPGATIRRDSGQTARGGKSGSASLLSLSQGVQRIEPNLSSHPHLNQTVSRSTSDLTGSQAPSAPPAEPPARHMLPMQLADGEGGGHGESSHKGKSLSSKSKSGKRNPFKKRN